MAKIEIGSDKIQIDADIVAKALKLEPHDMRDRMRAGTITSRFERGEGTDVGRMRLTFFSDTRRARITVGMAGTILSCTAVDYVASPKTPPTPKHMANPATGTEASDRDRLDALLDETLKGSLNRPGFVGDHQLN